MINCVHFSLRLGEMNYISFICELLSTKQMSPTKPIEFYYGVMVFGKKTFGLWRTSGLDIIFMICISLRLSNSQVCSQDSSVSVTMITLKSN